MHASRCWFSNRGHENAIMLHVCLCSLQFSSGDLFFLSQILTKCELNIDQTKRTEYEKLVSSRMFMYYLIACNYLVHLCIHYDKTVEEYSWLVLSTCKIIDLPSALNCCDGKKEIVVY